MIAKFTASLGTDDKQQATDYTEVITSSVGSYEIIAHITLFFEVGVREGEECDVSYADKWPWTVDTWFRDVKRGERNFSTLHCHALQAHDALLISGSKLGYRILNNVRAYLPYNIASLPRSLHVCLKYKVGQVIEQRHINLFFASKGHLAWLRPFGDRHLKAKARDQSQACPLGMFFKQIGTGRGLSLGILLFPSNLNIRPLVTVAV